MVNSTWLIESQKPFSCLYNLIENPRALLKRTELPRMLASWLLSRTALHDFTTDRYGYQANRLPKY